PSVGADSDGQVDLFPQLPAGKDQTDEELLSQARRLLTEPDFYQTVVTTAQEKMQTYGYEQSALRLNQLVADIQSKKV
ncbi:MAG: hypothetical protein WEC84_01360, partial [Candidatus Andersenbacteria bacterium]